MQAFEQNEGRGGKSRIDRARAIGRRRGEASWPTGPHSGAVARIAGGMVRMVGELAHGVMVRAWEAPAGRWVEG